MKRFFLIIAVCSGCFFALDANIAAPFGIPPVAGDLLPAVKLPGTLGIGKEVLILDVSEPYGTGAPCTAEYTIHNQGNEPVDTELYWDFFPFAAGGGFRNELGLICVLGF